MTDQELRDLVAENSRAIRENEKLIKKVSTEIGWIGNKWGRFTEGLFYPSLERILMEDLGLDTVLMRVTKRRNGTNMRIDVLGYTNSKMNTAVVVEVKSTLRDDDIRDFIKTLKEFPKFFPEHKDKKVFGMLAAVSISPEQQTVLEKHGVYVVRIKNDVFKIISSKKFAPKDFGLKP